MRSLLALFVFTVTADSQCRVPVWTDEFSGDSLDPTKWSMETGFWTNNELQYYTPRPENVSVRDGRLFITARKENFQGGNYTSGRLRTFQKGDWRYGLIEARMKVPVKQGMWPAFWMLPTDNYYGGYPRSGEIDIMELVGKYPSRIYGTLHTVDQRGQLVSSGEQYELPSGTFADEFHVFTAEWDPGRIRILIDGEPFTTVQEPFPDGGTWPFDRRFHIILNLAVGGTWPGPPDASTTFPQTLEVDFVRVYQRPEDITIEGPAVVSAGASRASYRVPEIRGAVYQWTVPDGAVIEGDSDTNIISVNWGDASGDIVLHLTTECGESDLQLSVAATNNMWRNPSFASSFQLWNPTVAQNGLAAFSVSADAPADYLQSAKVEVLRPASNAKDVQLARPDVPLREAQRYRLSFWARTASGPRAIAVSFLDSRDSTNYAARTFLTEAAWRPYTWEFQASKTAIAKMSVDLAKDVGTYQLTGFNLERIP